MFFILSKTIDILLFPYTWIVVVACFVVFSKQTKHKHLAGIILLCLLLIFAYKPFVNYLFIRWEIPAQPLNNIPDQSTAVILSGITQLNKQPLDRVFFSKGADRVTQAVWLYRKGKIKRFIISGGSGNLIGKGRAEAAELKKFLLDCQIPEQLILTEEKSKNTREDALFTKALIDHKSIKGPYLLITSAFHMRRAEACFAKVGLTCIPFPVDYYSADDTSNPINYVVPEAGVLSNFSLLAHEISGYLVYKCMGYI